MRPERHTTQRSVYVTHAQLEQLERRLDARFDQVLDRFDALERRVGAWGRWLRERGTHFVDGLVSRFALAIAAALIVYFVSH
jgi:hypothetical protein